MAPPYAEIAARGGGIRSPVRRTRAAASDDLAASAERYAVWFLRGGTTTIEAKSGYGLSLEAELKILRVIRQLAARGRLRYVATFLGAHEIPDEFRGRTSDYVRLVTQEMLPRVTAEGLAEYCDVFCEPNVFPPEQARAVLRAARDLGLGLRLHADQFTADAGAYSPRRWEPSTADHLEATTSAGLKALLTANVQPVLLPASVYNLGSTHYPAAREMITRGLPVVLATDFNPGSSPTASMPMALSPRLHPFEDDAGRGGWPLLQCCLQFAARPRNRVGRARQIRRFRHSRLLRLPGTSLFLRTRTGAKRLHYRTSRLPARGNLNSRKIHRGM